MRRVALVIAAIGVLGAIAIVRSLPPREAGRRPTISVVEALASSDEGFARATAPRAFTFPADHGPHPEFRTEWWYYTGNLSTPAGRRVGYQLTFFRIGLAAGDEPRGSRWAAREVWMAHFAVTDVAGGRFHARSRLARGALGLAGAAAQPFRVWLEDWSAESRDRASAPAMRLSARDGDVAVDLVLVPAKRPVLQGDRGLSRKGPEAGNASYYYSLTRMETRGTVSLGDARLEVGGTSWMDREWSTSALGAGQVGWDWFALQLDDGRELMLYRLRRADGAADPFSAGTLVERDGTSTRLGPDDVAVEVLDWWTSGRTGVRYPSRWRLAVPRAALVLDVVPRLAEQEWIEPVRYWEGAVEVRSAGKARRVRGDGYVELVGYAGPRRAPRGVRGIDPSPAR